MIVFAPEVERPTLLDCPGNGGTSVFPESIKIQIKSTKSESNR
uniref:Uncharacterized protein n=1 Tax=Rhizophora mucronata TaxID=61149 RepID=A0A2P2NBN7_RHIMU